MKVKDMPINLRPRERLKLLGSNNLTNQELLAIILKTGIKNKSSLDLALEVLKEFSENKNVTYQSLIKIKGIKEAKALDLIAMIELGNRDLFNKNNPQNLRSPTSIYNYMSFLKEEQQEYFYCLYFDIKLNLVSKKLLFKGTVDQSLVHPREIFKEAYLVSATSIVCVHNHPSGDPTPSKEDIRLTNSLVAIGKMNKIEISDHIIIGYDKYYSFYEDNNM